MHQSLTLLAPLVAIPGSVEFIFLCIKNKQNLKIMVDTKRGMNKNTPSLSLLYPRNAILINTTLNKITEE